LLFSATVFTRLERSATFSPYIVNIAWMTTSTSESFDRLR